VKPSVIADRLFSWYPHHMKTFSSKIRVLSLTLAVVSGSAFAATVDAPGVPNFHQVNQHLYRGAQPSDEGFKSLAKLGVKTVIDLRRPTEHSTSAEEKAVKAAGMRYVNIPMEGVIAPEQSSISKALSLMLAETDGPVFVHCKRGADRTGTVIAVYRMSHDRWGNSQAIHEAKSLGMSWTQVGLKHYIYAYRPTEAVAVAAEAAAPATVTP
jgi:tyrosine-protein phosphatase SIW14